MPIFLVCAQRRSVIGPHESHRGAAWQIGSHVIEQGTGKSFAPLRRSNANRPPNIAIGGGAANARTIAYIIGMCDFANDGAVLLHLK